MTSATQREYMRTWRKKHAHYSRDWQRVHRGSPRPAGRPPLILGVRVQPQGYLLRRVSA